MRSADAARTPLLLAGALALGLAVQVLLPAPPLPADALQPLRPALAPPRFAGLAQGFPAYAAIAERPLFTPRRSAARGADADVAPEAALSLLGVAAGGGRAAAVIRASGATYVAGAGEAVLGWRVVAIGSESAVVSRNGVSRTLRIGGNAAGADPASKPQLQPQPQQ